MGVLPNAPILRACGSTRIAEGPDSDSGSLGGASPFMPTTSRRLASAGTADHGNLKSPSLPGASPGSPTGVWFIGNSRPIRLKIEQPWECKSPHVDQFGMPTDKRGPGSPQGPSVLRVRSALSTYSIIEEELRSILAQFRDDYRAVWKGLGVAQAAGIPPSACSSKRTVRLINGIALDECRAREHYPARRPFLIRSCVPVHKSPRSLIAVCSRSRLPAAVFRTNSSHSGPSGRG